MHFPSVLLRITQLLGIYLQEASIHIPESTDIARFLNLSKIKRPLSSKKSAIFRKELEETQHREKLMQG